MTSVLLINSFCDAFTAIAPAQNYVIRLFRNTDIFTSQKL